MNKAKQILINSVRTLKSKANQKRREADRIEDEAENIQKEINGMKD